MAGLPSKDHRRIQLWLIQGADAQQVTFSQLRSGLFEKASETGTLCAGETALVVLFPGSKALSFGRPGVGPTMNRLVSCGVPDLDAIGHAEAYLEASLHHLVKKYSDLLEQLKAENLRAERVKKMRMESPSQGEGLAERTINELSLDELLTLKSMMDEFKEKLRKRMKELSVEPAASTPISAGETSASPGVSTMADSAADPHDHVGHEH